MRSGSLVVPSPVALRLERALAVVVCRDEMKEQICRAVSKPYYLGGIL